jgi:NTE family protein
MAASKKTKSKKLNLALQGGGAHGAYTWGVLDRLLDEKDIEFAGISGTSAGAMNAVILADGFNKGGRKKAKEQLAEFWRQVSQYSGVFSPVGKFDAVEAQQFNFGWNFAASWLDAISRTFSPYELNPMNINPLRDILSNMIDWDKLHHDEAIHLFVTATNVQLGQPRVFVCEEITLDVLLASACIPFLFQAVEIEGEPYWDGGYMGNPSIWPLIYKTHCDDVLLVQINPLERAGTPMRSMEIIDRLNEISFNSSLVSEMRAINFVKKLIENGKLDDKEYKNIRMHMIFSPDAMHGMTASTKLTANWDFFQYLHGVGYELTDQWLKENKAAIGKKATLDIDQVFLIKKHHPKTSRERAKSARSS